MLKSMNMRVRPAVFDQPADTFKVCEPRHCVFQNKQLSSVSIQDCLTLAFMGSPHTMT